MLSLEEWKGLSEFMQEHYRKHRPDIMADLTQQLNEQNAKDI